MSFSMTVASMKAGRPLLNNKFANRNPQATNGLRFVGTLFRNHVVDCCSIASGPPHFVVVWFLESLGVGRLQQSKMTPSM